MRLYSSNKNYKLYHGNMLDMLEVIESNTIDSIVTDPPYGLTTITKRFGKEDSVPAQYGKDGAFSRLSKGFMGKEWDGSGIEYNIDTWKKCYEVLKPGGYLLAFGGSRTFHRIACAIEDAGFEIRDTIMWLYGSGFPKSMSLDKVIEGKQLLGSANVRDIKKLDGIKENVKAGWNSNEVEQGKRSREYNQVKTFVNFKTELGKKWRGWGTCLKPSFEPIIVARKPFKGSLVDNVIENGVGGLNIDECRVETNGELIDNHITKGTPFMRNKEDYEQLDRNKTSQGRFPANTILTYDETPSDERLRYFYCAKASKKDRDEGLDEFETKKNTHPTVKPTELMQYLIRLVTPNGGTVLDPFNGSGSTGKATMYENHDRNKGYKYIGIELTEEYLPIAKARIEYVCNLKEDKQTDIFELID